MNRHSPTLGRRGFAAYSPKCDVHSNLAGAECPINSKFYYKLIAKGYLAFLLIFSHVDPIIIGLTHAALL